MFEEVLFFDKKFSEKEIFDKFENIVGEVNKETIDIGIGILIEFKNKEKKSEKYPLIIDALNIVGHLEKKFDSRSNSEKMNAFQEAFVLNLNKFDAKILVYAYSKNKRIRREARNSYLALSMNDPYRFFDEIDENSWNKICSLDDSKVRDLAKSLVKQIKLRGPFLSYADFVNRRILVESKPHPLNDHFTRWPKETRDSTLGLRGPIQAAISDSHQPEREC